MQKETLDLFRCGKGFVTDTTANRDPDACIPEISFTYQETNAYMVESTGASVTTHSSVILYINTVKSSQKIACRELHNLGAIDDHLLPYNDADNDVIGNTKNCVPGARTTKKKELHGTITVRALSGTWGEQTNGITLNAYKLDFSCDQVDEFYSGFVLLIEVRLDDDAANPMKDLFLIPKILVKSTVRPCGEIQLDGDQIKKARLFQEFFFNGMFGKLFIGSKSSGTPREFLLKREDNSLWSSSNIYTFRTVHLIPVDGLLQDKIHYAPPLARVEWIILEYLLKAYLKLKIIKVIVGKAYDRCHMWMCSKTISDCVETLIGAYYVGGGLSSALAMMKWFGIDAE
ncbi:hypothetical protein GIB67_039800 [Kingdonia uniflora]|uniref:Uncharacterized protein n=1 Tax=Kingdonia uniflora TaxID=39325 RepID=A0A7J7P323_9MAGN|nr:hypothetical protein GIB67_039800 [Kingdonia uniflora]